MTLSSDTTPDSYRALVTNFPNGVLVLFDADLRYRIVGPERLPFSGREAATMVGKTIEELFPADTVAELAPKLRATIDGRPQTFDIKYDGRVHHIETAPVRSGGTRHGVLVSQEVTEQRRTARELEAQNTRLEEFARLVSHDLRNPLSVAMARLDLAREDCPSEHHDTIADALHRMDRIIGDVLWLAREGEDIGTVEPVDLAVAIDDAWAMIETQSRDATLRYADAPDRFPVVQADGNRLSQLLENVFGNAVEHGGAGVTVGLLDDGFYIEDDGPGIPAEYRDRVFERGATTSTEGTGFGLPIVEQVANAHGWSVRVTEGSAGGARFEFSGIET